VELIYFDPSIKVNEFFFFKSCYPDKSAIKTPLFKTFDESILLFVSTDLRLLHNTTPLEWEAQEITLNYCWNPCFE